MKEMSSLKIKELARDIETELTRLEKLAIGMENVRQERESYPELMEELWVHLNFEESQKSNAFWEWGMGNWEWERKYFCKYEMLPELSESLALKLHNFYTGCERIFQLIASELNGGMPSGYDRHSPPPFATGGRGGFSAATVVSCRLGEVKRNPTILLSSWRF